MGIAQTDQVGRDYSALFNAADLALYSIKQGKRGKGDKYVFYEPQMAEMFSTRTATALSSILPAEGEEQGEATGGDQT